jgi:hypothetical protein
LERVEKLMGEMEEDEMTEEDKAEVRSLILNGPDA